MRQKRYESVEKMLDLLDVAKRIGPKFPLDAMFLDPNDRKSPTFRIKSLPPAPARRVP
jgi:hypothetical protein